MSTMLQDVALGKIILSVNAVNRMKRHGLKPFHVLETLKYGFQVKSLIPNTHQFVYVFDQFKQVQVVASDMSLNGKPLGAILIITCWATNIR
jgi:hypothetical protein